MLYIESHLVRTSKGSWIGFNFGVAFVQNSIYHSRRVGDDRIARIPERRDLIIEAEAIE